MNTSSRPTDCVDSDINEDLVLLTGLSTVDDASTVECVSFDSPQKSKSAQMSDPKCDIQPNETTQPHQLPTKEVNNLTDVEVRHRHNKPKKAYVSMINEQDYICDEEDMNVIDSIRDSRDGRTVVEVDGHVIAFSSFKCLLNPTAFLDGEVINTYISLINSEPHLLVRDGLSVHITDSIQYQYLYNAGHHLVKQNVSNERILEWVSNYIQRDLVFIPINVPDSHWYLAVINAKKRQIQVLDSLGRRTRAELAYAICGVQRYIDIASGILKDMDHKWPDLQVANWPFVEQFSVKMQRDGHSCGLFLLNFIEYWTGERLSDNIAQIHMSNFRLKLAAILLDTPLNTKRGCPDDDSSSGSKKGDPDDCVLLGDSKDSYKHAEHINGSTSKINAMKYVRVSGDIIDFLLKCTDPDALRLEWVRNTKPYPIAITLGMLQDLLRLEVSMSIDCFNFVVRMYSNEEATLSMDPLCYFADLQLSLQSNYRVWYGNRPKRDQCLLMNVFPDNLETGAAVIACDLVLVPFHFRGEYSIYCFDGLKRTITIVEATHKPLQTGVTPGYCRHYNDKIQKICRVFDHAMEIVSPEYNDDSYDWWRTIVHDPWLLGSREQTGFSVLLTMWFWDAKYKLKNAIENKDPMIVRKYFFTHVLTSKWNECTESIPDDILRALRIENQRLAKCLFG